ncbi:14567_t:CDS:1, partial [Dentiscutata heterogama]
DNIIKQVYVIMNDNNTAFKDNYCKKRRYPYTPTTLNFLSDKTALFLLQHF